jgi:hypothetical protein
MRLYFSGISGREELRWIIKSKTKHWLIDWVDLKKILNYSSCKTIQKQWKAIIPDDVSIIIDSGAYKFFKKGKSFPLTEYLDFLNSIPLSRVHKVIMPDVIGDFEATWNNYLEVKNLPFPWIPVWGWGDSHERLAVYLDSFEVVGIGGLVKLMRLHKSEDKDEKRLAEETCEKLIFLTEQYPNRFHIFGTNWLKALQQFTYAYSCDTSKAWDGARYGSIIFKHTINQNMCIAPARVIPEYKHLTRGQLCVKSVCNLDAFFNQ